MSYVCGFLHYTRAHHDTLANVGFFSNPLISQHQFMKPASGASRQFQELCDGIYALEGISSCYVVNTHGKMLAARNGNTTASKELRSRYGILVAVVWGSLQNIEVLGGPLLSVSATYRKFKVLGVPVPNSGTGVVVRIPAKMNAAQMRQRILHTVDRLAGQGWHA